jgi:hypothetical protein
MLCSSHLVTRILALVSKIFEFDISFFLSRTVFENLCPFLTLAFLVLKYITKRAITTGKPITTPHIIISLWFLIQEELFCELCRWLFELFGGVFGLSNGGVIGGGKSLLLGESSSLFFLILAASIALSI